MGELEGEGLGDGEGVGIFVFEASTMAFRIMCDVAVRHKEGKKREVNV